MNLEFIKNKSMIKVGHRKHSLKVISLFASLTLWAYIMMSENVEIEKTFYLNFLPPKNYEVVKTSAEKVIVYMSTTRLISKQLEEQQDQLLIELHHEVSQTQFPSDPSNVSNLSVASKIGIQMTHDRFKIPLGARILRFNPSQVDIELIKRDNSKTDHLSPQKIVNGSNKKN